VSQQLRGYAGCIGAVPGGEIDGDHDMRLLDTRLLNTRFWGWGKADEPAAGLGSGYRAGGSGFAGN
jgi:hypothetical protein